MDDRRRRRGRRVDCGRRRVRRGRRRDHRRRGHAHRRRRRTRRGRGERRWRRGVKRRRRNRSARRRDRRLNCDIWLWRRVACWRCRRRLRSLNRKRCWSGKRFGYCRCQRFADGCNRGWRRHIPRRFRRDWRGGWARCVWGGDHGQRLTARNRRRVGRSNGGRRSWQRQRGFPTGFVATGAAAGPAAFGEGDYGQRLTARNGRRVGRNDGGRRGRQRQRRFPRGFRRDRRDGWARCVWGGNHGQRLTARNRGALGAATAGGGVGNGFPPGTMGAPGFAAFAGAPLPCGFGVAAGRAAAGGLTGAGGTGSGFGAWTGATGAAVPAEFAGDAGADGAPAGLPGAAPEGG